MLTPKELDDLPQSLIEIYSKAELDILADMCRRISNYDFFIPAAKFQYKKMIEMGNIHDDILKAMSEMSGIFKEHIIALMDEAGAKAITFDDGIYKKAGLNPVPISNSRALQDVLKEGIKKTLGEFTNLTQTTAKATTRQIEIALDNAYMQITTGAFDSNTAIRNAVKYLSGNGMATFEYNNSFNYLESAVRRAVLTGINQTCCKLQTTRADEMECDLVEVTAHAGARTGEGVNNHSNWQGKVYSRSGKSNKYPDFISSTGYGTVTGLAGVNCRHSFYPFFENISKRTYTDEQLKEYKGKKYTYNGKELTEYEATQLQRKFERNIRKYKREINSLNSINYDCEFEKNKLAKWQEKQTDFISQTGLKRHKYRERVFTTKKDFEREKSSRKSNSNSINKELINSKEYKDKFKGISDNKETDDLIYNKAKDMLNHRNNTDFEDMYLINPISKKVVGVQVHSKRKLVVNYNRSLASAIKRYPQNTLISIHNHPNSKLPSGGDFASQYKFKYNKGVIVCHNGDVIVYRAGKKEISSYIYDISVDKYQKYPYNYSEKDAYIETLSRFKKEYGIEWEIR